MSRFVVMDEAEQGRESAEPLITAVNHPGGKAGQARLIPCAPCVRRLTSGSPSQYQPCYDHLGRNAKKCFQCSSKKKLCHELPPNAVSFGQEFQNATIRRFAGQAVDDWKILGEKTMQAIDEADERPVKGTRRGLAGIVPTNGTGSWMEDDTSECGQPQVDLEEQQPTIQQQLQQPQPPCQEEPAQSTGDFQPPIQNTASRQDLQELRAQILHDVRQVLVESNQHQRQRQDDCGGKEFAPSAPPAAEPQIERNSLNEIVQDIVDAAQRSRKGVATIVIHFR
ncbi:hypothetical protein CCMA1212_005981 [Trichoderma ghanense]|uniref:Uncharacterized protein n=1 Tax=Trichoderma ghanense TaxID=65468 RepID=A0ABY2H4D2_9HYPO